jgi:hypothetical protein
MTRVAFMVEVNVAQTFGSPIKEYRVWLITDNPMECIS